MATERDPELVEADEDGGHAPVPGVPSDNTTMTSVIAGLDEQGYVHQFTVAEHGRLTCSSCGTTNGAEEFDIKSNRRLEGASDPGDLVSVIAVTCPECRARGTVVLGYGPEASPDDADVSVAIARSDSVAMPELDG